MSNNPLDIAAFRCVESVGFAFGALSLKTLCFFPMAFKETLSFGKKSYENFSLQQIPRIPLCWLS